MMKRQVMNEKNDRLRYLPDSVLLRIFSFLPTKSFLQARILSKRWQNVESLHEDCTSRIHSWVDAALNCGVEELDLYTNYITISFPSRLFDCDSLVGLKLDVGCFIEFPGMFCFPKLKRMQLSPNLVYSLLLPELVLNVCSWNLFELRRQWKNTALGLDGKFGNYSLLKYVYID
ncbi:hypothetical protein Pint_31026 [Pistacia integerrima]|uniref:Uncharacterized protein n=1 Tax=Pistacia integerrima TaxID=434235 RepID=A0ACC0XRW1_9ROSI|nr:hypothetical protein Pint_31026 [Pistacia integerrima]